MLVHPQFDPVAIQLGPLSVRWYGLMYLAGFALAMWLGRRRIAARPDLGWSARDLDDIIFWGVLGVVLGGRIGHVLFYAPGYYLSHPLEVFAVWQGGMSFHGGLLGVIAAMVLFARSRGRPWLAVTDFIAPLVPPGLGAGRLGNFINGELWGRPTDLPWGMLFPQADGLARHPSQLYELALEGVALFVILWLWSARPRPLGAVSGLFLVGYGCFRSLAEFVREPDGWVDLAGVSVTVGQALSLPMVAIGIAMLAWAYRGRRQG